MASSTREKILAVSLRLFNEQGYRNVTMRAIDRRAERARGTGLFYRILHAGGLPDADSNPADEPHDVA